MTPYANAFERCRNVLDVGCGPGLFLELLKARGIGALGLDYDPEMVEACKRKGLNAQVAEARTLSKYEQEFDGIHLGHLIEHLDGPSMLTLLQQCVVAMRPGGLLVVRTPNWSNETVRNGGFWLDHTHVRPYPLELLKKVFQDLGLEVTHAGHETSGWEDTYILGRKRAAELDGTDDGPQTTDRAENPESGIRPSTKLRTSNPESAFVVWSAPLLEVGEDAEDAREFVVGLDGVGMPLKPEPVKCRGRRADLPEEELQRLERMAQRELGRDFLHVQHVEPRFYQVTPGAVANIGRANCGTDRIPAEWVTKCNAMDEVWLPSDFALEAFAFSGVDRSRLHKVPLSINLEQFGEHVEPLKMDDRRGFMFLSVLGWSARSGWGVLLQAYMEEFRAGENVGLVLKFLLPQGVTEQMVAEEVRSYLKEELQLAGAIPKLNVHLDPVCPGLYRAVDAFVLPSRAEGLGRHCLEAMASGLPVIATGWGGQTEFMNSENSYPIRYSLVDVPEPLAADEPELAGARWAEPSVEHFRSLMREVFEDREGAREKGRKAREHIAANYSRERVAQQVKERLEAIFEKVRPDCGLRIADSGLRKEEAGPEGASETEDQREQTTDHRPQTADLKEQATEPSSIIDDARIFGGCENVLVIHCGRGEFLEQLQSLGVHGTGLADSEEDLQHCRSRQLDVTLDTVSDLKARGECFDGIYAAYALERMNGPEGTTLLEDAAGLLKPEGYLVVRTANAESDEAREQFWKDRSHVRPYPLKLLTQTFCDLGLEPAYYGWDAECREDSLVIGRRPGPRPPAPEGRSVVLWRGP